jgi:hypothetical protein
MDRAIPFQTCFEQNPSTHSPRSYAIKQKETGKPCPPEKTLEEIELFFPTM